MTSAEMELVVARERIRVLEDGIRLYRAYCNELAKPVGQPGFLEALNAVTVWVMQHGETVQS